MPAGFGILGRLVFGIMKPRQPILGISGTHPARATPGVVNGRNIKGQKSAPNLGIGSTGTQIGDCQQEQAPQHQPYDQPMGRGDWNHVKAAKNVVGDDRGRDVDIAAVHLDSDHHIQMPVAGGEGHHGVHQPFDQKEVQMAPDLRYLKQTA
jgi:hypothetical protein